MKKIIKLLSFITTLVIGFTLGINNINAETVYFKTTTSSSKVVVGKSITVNVKVSSSNVLGSWEYTIDYDSSILSLTSGEKSIATYGNGSQKSVTYNYTFKAIKSGSSKISVKSYGAFDWDEAKLSPSVSSTSISVITQAQLEASYSKNNNLSTLTVEGFSVSPEFNKDTLDYTVELSPGATQINIGASPSDKRSNIVGTGTFDVVEGENKFTITVTAENGSVKTYNLIANVIDPNPIKVKTIDNKELTIVKRSSVITIPNNYTESSIKINDQDVPAFINEINKITLVGLKDDKGNIKLYVYNEIEKTYTLYTELKLNNLVLYPLNVEEESMFDYKKSSIKINEEQIDCYKYKSTSSFAIIYAMDTETGKKNYYMYDIKNNTAIIYNGEEIDDLKKTLDTYYIVILTLSAESAILFIILIFILIKRIKKNQKRKNKIKQELENVKKTKIENMETEEIKTEDVLIKNDKPKKDKKKKKDKHNSKDKTNNDEFDDFLK